MQDRYVADVGDFGKYGLLRCLAGITCGNKKDKMKLGVIWYRTPSCEGNEGDGKHLSYLDSGAELQKLDRELFDSLHDVRGRIATRGRDGNWTRKDEHMRIKDRTTVENPALEMIEKDKLLDGAAFFSNPLQKSRTKADAIRERGGWWNGCCDNFKKLECDLIFMDPDNGLRVKYSGDDVSLVNKDAEKPSIKHVYVEEIKEVISDWRASLVLYHHLGRHGGDHDNQIRLIGGALKKVAPKSTVIRALRYRRGSSRAFFVLIREQHKTLQSRINDFQRSSWVEEEHFNLFD